MNILVFGGAGFLGYNFLLHLTAKYPNYQIFCLDKLTYAANKEFLEDIVSKRGVIFFKEDIVNFQKIKSIIKKIKPEVIINFAAESHVDRSIKRPLRFFKTNVCGVQSILEAIRTIQKLDKFIQISTDEVYGDIPLDSSISFNEEACLNPSSPYSASKASADLLMQAYNRTLKFQFIILRPCNVFGKYQNKEKFIPKIINQAKNSLPLTLYGDGQNIREWLYVDDCSHAVDLIMHHAKPNQIYNIGSGIRFSNIEIANVVLQRFNGGCIKFIKDRPGHDRKYSIDSKKIQRDLGWSAYTTFSEGMDSTINYYDSL